MVKLHKNRDELGQGDELTGSPKRIKSRKKK